MKKNKTVFDVNIWVSYFLMDKADEIYDMIKNKEVVLFRSPELTTELRNVLQRPKIKKYFTVDTEDYMAVYESLTNFYSTFSSFTDCPDPNDNYLFDLAYQSSANYLVSGDKKVLATPVKPSLKVLKLVDFKTITA